jgi:hypothetical protein
MLPNTATAVKCILQWTGHVTWLRQKISMLSSVEKIFWKMAVLNMKKQIRK